MRASVLRRRASGLQRRLDIPATARLRPVRHKGFHGLESPLTAHSAPCNGENRIRWIHNVSFTDSRPLRYPTCALCRTGMSNLLFSDVPRDPEARGFVRFGWIHRPTCVPLHDVRPVSDRNVQPPLFGRAARSRGTRVRASLVDSQAHVRSIARRAACVGQGCPTSFIVNVRATCHPIPL